MDITAISDLHGNYPELEGGDLLIIAGDCTKNDKIPSWHEFFTWLEKQKYRKKIIVAGNHDNFCKSWDISGTFSADKYEQMYPGEKSLFDYLADSGTEFEGLRIWGSPWTKTFTGMNSHCMAFTADTDEELIPRFALIPPEIDILITHSPPYGILDKVEKTTKNGTREVSVGSRYLRGAIEYAFRPKLWVFGHVHEGYGQHVYKYTTLCVNASHVNEKYQPVNKPVRITL